MEFKNKSIYDWPFPDDLFGQTIDGIDVAMLASDSLRLMAAYAQQSELSDIQKKVLRHCGEELKQILPHLSGYYAKEYFQKLFDEVEKI